jgi:hypothetical protein
MDCSTYISPARLHLLCFAPGLPICTLALFRLLRARRTPCVALRPPTSLPMCHHATACRSCHRASLCHGTASGRISGREGVLRGSSKLLRVRPHSRYGTPGGCISGGEGYGRLEQDARSGGQVIFKLQAGRVMDRPPVTKLATKL